MVLVMLTCYLLTKTVLFAEQGHGWLDKSQLSGFDATC